MGPVGDIASRGDEVHCEPYQARLSIPLEAYAYNLSCCIVSGVISEDDGNATLWQC